MKLFSVTPLFLIVAALSLQAQIQVQLNPSLPSPQPVGTTITWTASASDSNSGTFDFQFAASFAGGSFAIVRDYSLLTSFQWTPSQSEGSYQIQVTARNNSTLQTAQAAATFIVTPLATGSTPVVTAVPNPLVALFSVPSCPSGSGMRVRFQLSGSSTSPVTSTSPCNPPYTMNFYVAGMLATSRYLMHSETITGSKIVSGPALSFRTGRAPRQFPKMTVITPPSSQDSLTESVLLTTFIGGARQFGGPVGTDLSGNALWYYEQLEASGQHAYVTRVVPGGTMLLIVGGNDSNNNPVQAQILREIDLAGNTVRETNASRISEQLVAMGHQSSCQSGSLVCLFGAFSHDAIRLPNGNTIAMGLGERIFPAGTQGSQGPVDILGDVVVVLDSNWQVLWSWNAFDHLDISRPATLNDKCANGTAYCVLYLASVANDWLHGNTVYYIPSEGDLLFSFRSQDWVVKVDYSDGAGTGDVIWRLGLGGDFTMNSTDPYPWFSHQHDAGFEQNGTQIFSVFDNGNTRKAQNPSADSRGQVLNIDETNLAASLALNADLGAYSNAFGSAQGLLNGNYHFYGGVIQPGPVSRSYEILPDGTIGYEIQGNLTGYRSFRLTDLYTPPVK